MSKEPFLPKTALAEEVLKARVDQFVEFSGIRSKINDLTNLYTIIGIGHLETRARYFHEVINQSLGLDQHHLRPVEVPSLRDALEDFLMVGMRGVTVTIPFKEDAYRAIQFAGKFGDVPTQLSGAVNTIINENGKLIGWNTDITGFVDSLSYAQVNLNQIDVAVVGVGGMGRAAMCGLGLGGAKRIFVFDNDFNKAERAVNEIQQSFPQTEFVITQKISECITPELNLIAQCSPEGMASTTDSDRVNRTAIPPSLIPQCAAVIDAVYVPLETQFLKDAKERGCKTIVFGSKIVVYGGLKQIQLYLGRPQNIPDDIIGKAERAVIEGVFSL